MCDGEMGQCLVDSALQLVGLCLIQDSPGFITQVRAQFNTNLRCCLNVSGVLSWNLTASVITFFFFFHLVTKNYPNHF